MEPLMGSRGNQKMASPIPAREPKTPNQMPVIAALFHGKHQAHQERSCMLFSIDEIQTIGTDCFRHLFIAFSVDLLQSRNHTPAKASGLHFLKIKTGLVHNGAQTQFGNIFFR